MELQFATALHSQHGPGGGETVNPGDMNFNDRGTRNGALLAAAEQAHSEGSMVGQPGHSSGSVGVGGGFAPGSILGGGSIDMGPDATTSGWHGITRTDEEGDFMADHHSTDGVADALHRHQAEEAAADKGDDDSDDDND